ncbi:DoxX family membrane protein [Streptomyces sp. SCSIO 30461]|uniref:DoxX family membrane protein n=1 Tax=Streptomyces sp. SCSIO 30461 TaxID=3118085 RepID=UPI0030CE1314
MSVDTRTPRPGFDETPLSMVKVNCDPAQVIVNHASFRVKLGQSQTVRGARGMADTTRIPAAGGARAAARRRTPVVWSGRSAPGDPGATGLLQAVRNSGSAYAGTYGADAYGSGTYGTAPYDAGPGLRGTGYDHDPELGATDLGIVGATQVLPRVGLASRRGAADATRPTPAVGAGGQGGSGPRLPHMRRAADSHGGAPHGGRAARDAYDAYEPYGQEAEEEPDFAYVIPQRDQATDAGVRHAYYPGRRMNLGVVLLPLRVFLGFISVYAGMGKLCDPVYFDGGERGSMIKWLHSLDPWAIAGPLRDFALSHPVGAGLTVAFLQVAVGVLTVLGLWQRVAAVVGALLSAALIMTVSWRTAPVYDAPDIMTLAAWSPLIIAGAPVYSVDSRLAGEAWRTLGPRSELWDLRRRVLRRGGMLAAVLVGLTLLVGSMLGGAVRSSELVTVPGPDVDPTNHLPGSALPQEPGERGPSQEAKRPEPSKSESSSPAAERTEPSEAATEGSESTGQAGTPSESQGTGNDWQPPTRPQPDEPPSDSSRPSAGGGSASGGGQGSGGGTGGGSGNDVSGGASGAGDGSGGGNTNPIGGLLG